MEHNVVRFLVGVTLVIAATLPMRSNSQTFLAQCPKGTALHPEGGKGPGEIKCQEIAGTDGFATMGDGTQIYMFGFGPLSGRGLVSAGLPGTQNTTDFNKPMYDLVHSTLIIKVSGRRLVIPVSTSSL